MSNNFFAVVAEVIVQLMAIMKKYISKIADQV